MTTTPAPRRTAPVVRVDPYLIFGISLFVALAVSWPTLSGAMHGTVDIVQAGVHLLVAVAVSWAGCYAVGSLVYGYSQSAAMHEGPANERVAVTAAPQRRATDLDATAPALPAPTGELGAGSDADAA